MKRSLLLLAVLLQAILIFSADTPWGYFKAYGQTWYKVEESAGNTFQFRRVRVKTGGDIVEGRIGLALQLDLLSDDVNLLDLKIRFRSSIFDLTVGRFLVPMDIYTPVSPWNLNTLEYPLLEEFSPWREEGILLKGTFGPAVLYAMVANGSGSNTFTGFIDTDSEKAYMLRMDLVPFEDMYLSVSGWQDHFIEDERWSISRRFNIFANIREKNFLFRAQFTAAEDEDEFDRNFYSYSYFVNLSFFVADCEFVTRYEFFDRDKAQPGEIRTRFTAGLNCDLLGPGLRLSVNYQINGESQDLLNNILIFQLLAEL